MKNILTLGGVSIAGLFFMSWGVIYFYNKKKTIDIFLKLNDVVIIKDDKPFPRTQWRMGRIQDINGKDGKIRGARLKVNSEKETSSIHRPV